MSDEISRTWKMLYAFSCLLIFGAFAFFGWPDKGVVAGFSCAAVTLSLKVRWDLIRKIWFLSLFFIFIAMHIFIIFNFNSILYIKPTILYAPIAIVDFVFMVVIIYLLENFFDKNE